MLRVQVRLEAMRGNFDLARELAARGLGLAEELGLEVQMSGLQSESGELELLAGRPAAAEPLIRATCDALEQMGNHGHYVTVAVGLGEALLRQDKLDEAAALIERIEDWAIDDDLDPQIGWRRLKATLLARRGEFAEAERIGREAVELAGRGDYIDTHGRTLADLGGVLLRAGRPEEASVALADAVRLFEQKGDVVWAARARALAESI